MSEEGTVLQVTLNHLKKTRALTQLCYQHIVGLRASPQNPLDLKWFFLLLVMVVKSYLDLLAAYARQVNKWAMDPLPKDFAWAHSVYCKLQPTFVTSSCHFCQIWCSLWFSASPSRIASSLWNYKSYLVDTVNLKGRTNKKYLVDSW